MLAGAVCLWARMSPRKFKLKILQINLNRCRLAQDLLVQQACHKNADVVIVPEPYRQMDQWTNDTTGNASLWVTGFNGFFPTLTPPLAAEGIVAAVIEDCTIVSAYCAPSKKFPEYMAYLDTLGGILNEARRYAKTYARWQILHRYILL